MKFTRHYRYHIEFNVDIFKGKSTISLDLKITQVSTIEAIIPFVDDRQYRLPRVNTSFLYFDTRPQSQSGVIYISTSHYLVKSRQRHRNYITRKSCSIVPVWNVRRIVASFVQTTPETLHNIIDSCNASNTNDSSSSQLLLPFDPHF